MNMQWNLEQLRLFVSVAELRSFSAVARQQRKAQSAISNAIALLEEDLGVSLFERSSGRQPKLSEAGSALLQEAREILRQCDRLNGRALALMRGQEARLRLAQDEAMPYQPVLDSLEALAERFPSLEVQLASGAQGDVARKLVERRADLGLLFHHEQMPETLERQALGRVAQDQERPGVAYPLQRAPDGTLLVPRAARGGGQAREGRPTRARLRTAVDEGPAYRNRSGQRQSV